MAAYEEKIPVDEKAEQCQRSTMEEYKQKHSLWECNA